MRAERDHDRDDDGGDEQRGETVAAVAKEQSEAREREHGRQPAEEDERLAALRGARRTRSSRPSSGRPPRATARARGASRESRSAARARAATTAAAAPGSASRQPRPRTNAYATKNGTAPSARLTCPESGIAAIARRPEQRLPLLDREQRERQEERDRPEQMPGALRDAVRRERERESADECCAARQSSARSHAHVAPPAPAYVSSVKRFHASTAPNEREQGPVRHAERRAPGSSRAARARAGSCTGPATARSRARAGGRRARGSSPSAGGRRGRLDDARCAARRGSACRSARTPATSRARPRRRRARRLVRQSPGGPKQLV